MNRVVQLGKARPEVLLVAAMLLATFALPKRAPLGVYGLGLVSAGLLVLPAVAIILVYRANGIINFAQIMIGTATGTLFTVLTTAEELGPGRRIGYFPIVSMIGKVCDPCVDRVGIDPSYVVLRPGTYVANYVAAILLCLAVATLLMMLCYLIIQRFTRAPRLIVTVSTIFVGQIVSGLGKRSTEWLVPSDQRGLAGVGFRAVPPPFQVEFHVGKVVFDETSIVIGAVVSVLLLLLWAFLSRSPSGTAIRAAAENPARVATLGIDARGIVGKVWLVSGLLAGAFGVLLAMLQGIGDINAPDAVFSVPMTVRVLAVVVLARFASLPIAVLAAVVLGMAQEAVRWSYNSTVALDGSLLAVIAVALLLQRRQLSRAEAAQATSWQADREIRPIPRELRGVPAVRTWVRTAMGIGIALPVGAPWVLSAGQQNLVTLAVLYMMIGLSLLVLTGWAGQISLGQVALAATGAWAAAWSGLPFVFAILVGAAAGALAATAVGIPALRLRGLNLAIITLAFAVTVSSFLLDRHYLGDRLPDRLDRPSFLGLDLNDQRTHYYVMLAFLGLVALAVLGMRRSRTARAFIALRDNEQAAQSFGIVATRARLSAFAVSGAIAGLAGALIAYTDGAVDPSRFTPDFGVALFLAMVMGGFGSILGPLLGGLYLGVLPLFGAVGILIGQFGGAGGLALILSIGGGLSRLVYQLRDSMLRRVANRNGIVVPSLVADLLADGTRRLIPITPKRRDGGGTAFVPQRYRVSDQWAFGETVAVQEVDLELAYASPRAEAVTRGDH